MFLVCLSNIILWHFAVVFVFVCLKMQPLFNDDHAQYPYAINGNFSSTTPAIAMSPVCMFNIHIAQNQLNWRISTMVCRSTAYFSCTKINNNKRQSRFAGQAYTFWLHIGFAGIEFHFDGLDKLWMPPVYYTIKLNWLFPQKRLYFKTVVHLLQWSINTLSTTTFFFIRNCTYKNTTNYKYSYSQN